MKTLAFFLLSLFVAWSPPATFSAERPNVVLILMDDFGRELIGALGGESYATPNIDALARDGMTFEICYATPMCSPTRNLLLSGKYNFRNYTAWGEYRFNDEPTIANTLSDAGYSTGVAGKWHLGGWEEEPFGPTRAGFQHYATFNYPEQLAEDDLGIGNFFWNTHLWQDGGRKRLGETYSSAAFRDFCLEFIDSRSDADKPFFFYYPMILTHRPFVPTDLTEKSGANHRGRKGDRVHFPDMVTYVDNTVGAIRKKLKETGQADNTLLLFTADNGTDNVSDAKELRSQWKGQMLKGGKYVPTELGANVPFFAVWPGTVAPGSRYSKPTDLTDLHVTLAHLAGAGKPDNLDGHDLTPVLLGTGESTRQYAYTWGVHDYSSRKYKTPITYKGELLHILRDERWKYQSDNTLWDLKEGWPQAETIPKGEQKEVRERMRAALRALRNSEPKLW
ncbi:MAG: sulfatase-like hydrolase/transferase [Verrucomicrobiales bacterium]|nr:sulfatase-like hydrolase/transferase [Verrucomicrobiales bacterium]